MFLASSGNTASHRAGERAKQGAAGPRLWVISPRGGLRNLVTLPRGPLDPQVFLLLSCHLGALNHAELVPKASGTPFLTPDSTLRISQPPLDPEKGRKENTGRTACVDQHLPAQLAVLSRLPLCLDVGGPDSTFSKAIQK